MNVHGHPVVEEAKAGRLQVKAGESNLVIILSQNKGKNEHKGLGQSSGRAGT